MNWKVTYYDEDDNIISSHVIENRTEHQAEHEAEADMPGNCEDWSMVEI